MANLSEKNRDITFVPVPQSPAIAGFITETADGTAPTGWLECDGTAVSRTTYAELFAAVGTTYGVGDGSTTFNLPTEASVYDAVNMIVIIKAYTDAAGVSVGLTKTKYQYKYLSSDTGSSTGTVSDLTFNNLEVGKTYRWVGSLRGGNDGTVDVQQLQLRVELEHNSGVLDRCEFQIQGDDAAEFTINRNKIDMNMDVIFVAAATTVTVDIDLTNSMELAGDGTAVTSWARLEELPRHEVTTDFT